MRPLTKNTGLLLALLGCAAFYAAMRATQGLAPADPALPARIEGTFPLGGQNELEPLARAASVRCWGSWAHDDANTGALTLGPFPAPVLLRFAVSGYPTHDGNQIFVERADTHARLPVKFIFDVGERWRVVDFAVPPDWVGRPITLNGRDEAKAIGGWIALSEPLRGGHGSGAAELFETLAAWSINGVLLGLLWFAALRFVTARAWVAPHWAPLLAAAGVAACGYAAFWAYFAHALAGKIFSALVLVAGAVGALRPQKTNDFPAAEALVAPKFLLVIGLFYMALLHLYPSSQDFYALAANRWGALPGDNTLPHNVAHDLFHGTSLRWPGADWLSSDRPPLQSGWMLLTWPVNVALGLDERTAGGTAAVWLQSLWVLAAYGLLRTLGLARARTVAWLALLGVAGFFAQNTVFTWPKFSAAAFACGAFGLWLFPGVGGAVPSPRFASAGEGTRPPTAFLLGAALAALAWLSHGGVAFSFLALAPWIAWRAIRGQWRAWVLAAAVFALFAVPWLAYQKFYDPPGNRLLKWHLAGVQPKDSRGTWQTIRESYAALTWPQIWAHKKFNLTRQLEGDWHWWRQFTPANAAQRRNDEFFFTARALTWWLLGFAALPIALVRGRLRTAWRAQAALAAWTLLTIPLWCALMFSGGQAVIHQGSYAVMLGLFVLLSAWCELASPWTLALVGVLQAVSFATTWAVPNDTIRGPLNFLALGLAVTAATTLVLFAVREHRNRNVTE